ncbi:CUB domain-containing protein [Tenacibaculum amylolyticum]|uniref:CUB domain-containing protein n=1 Tax=Tenacibaculum amylolyticum TaxID=104269 RepID=UPI0038955D53
MKNSYYGRLFLPVAFVLFSLNATAQTKKQVEQIRNKYNLSKLQTLEKELLTKSTSDKKEAFALANRKGWKTKITTKDGRLLELQKVVNGKPIYYTTFNADAARSTRTNHLNSGGSLGLDLNGQGMTAHVWDGGIARASHQEYDGAGGRNRFSVGDNSNSLDSHAAHVTGTIISSGVEARAKGMAPYARAVGYDWTSDKAEATAATGNGMLVSNHSYGFSFRNPDTGQVWLPQYFFGGYIEESRAWDEIMFNAPNYLMVVAAGNDGRDDAANANPTGGRGWDKLTGHSTSKNNLVVANAQDANVDANGNLIAVVINSSSSEGPTDDMRIKPDITGNGTNVYSTYQNSNTAYATITGTSMASPNVAGSLLLLQQHNNNTHNAFMRAATLKGLALHTADDAGAAGPDAVFGWGLLNAKKAAQTITNRGTQSRIEELTLNGGDSYSIEVDSDGTSPLLASISWTDRPGTAITEATAANAANAVLVNDLDIRITKDGNTYMPYELTSPTTSARRDNNVDPYERVDISNASGRYTITVTHKGNLTGGSQNFSLIVTGLAGGAPVAANPCDGGATLTANNGSFADGSGNSNYADNRNCTWLIRPENGGTVTLNFDSFNTESGYDFVRVYDGANDSATELGEFSGTSRPAAVTSTGNAMYVKFTSDGSINAAGWSASYTSTVANVDTQAPSVPTNVTATEITQTTATLSWTASTDNVGVTGYDIYRGTSNLGSREGTTVDLTGLVADRSYTFSIRAKDAAGNESAGGSVTFRTLAVTPPASDPCDGGATLTADSGSFTDGSGNSNYADNRNCSWLIRPSNGGTVTLSFDSFNTERNYDEVTVYDGANANARELGSFSGTSIPAAVTSTGNTLFVKFTSDGSVNAAGWSASYVSNEVAAGDPCDGGVTLTANNGSFTDGSATSSNYTNNRNCTWLIRPTSGNRVTLNFSRFNTENRYDVVTVFDGTDANARELGSFSGASVPAAITSTGGAMFVRFTSDRSVTSTGWAASYTTAASNSEFNTSASNELFENVTVYPNPVEGNTLFVRALGIDKATYRVLNTLGQAVQKGDLKEEINVSILESGIYVLEVNNGEKTLTKKFIKK